MKNLILLLFTMASLSLYAQEEIKQTFSYLSKHRIETNFNSSNFNKTLLIPLKVISFNFSEDQGRINQDISIFNELFKKCAVQIDPNIAIHEYASTSTSVTLDDNQPDEFRKVISQHSFPGVIAIYVDYIAPFIHQTRGIAYSPAVTLANLSAFSTTFVKKATVEDIEKGRDKRSINVFAHEIGHLILGNTHTHERKNLMQASVSPANKKITRDQCISARGSVLKMYLSPDYFNSWSNVSN